MLFLFCCIKITKLNEENTESSTVTDSVKVDETSESALIDKLDKNIATLSDAEKKTIEISTKSQIPHSELKKIKPSIAFQSFFNLADVPVIKRYQYDNLEILYSCEQYFENRFSNKIEDYFNENKNEYMKKLDKVAFLGDTCVDNIFTKFNLLPEKNVMGMQDKSISEQLGEIDNFDFKNFDTLLVWNGFTSKGLVSNDEYISMYDKIFNIIKEKNPKIQIYVCSLLPIGLMVNDTYELEKRTEFNNKVVEINDLLKKHYKNNFIDISFLLEMIDFEYDGFYTDKFNMKNICYIANYLDVKNKIIDAPMPTLKEIEYKEPDKKYIYMTFDDGPSINGKWLLSILDKYNVKVTMFYTGNSAEWRQNIIDFSNDNQKIAAHTFTHNFKIYESEEKYFEDLYKIESLLKTLTGRFTRIVRFPGGSANTTSKNHSIGIMKKLVEDFKYMGYSYYDWNASSGDGSKNVTSEQILENAKNGVKKFENPVVLFHETHDYTVAIIEDFIKWAIEEGYEFKILDYDTIECHQSYSKLN